MREIIAKIRDEFGVSRPEAELIVAALLERPRFELYYQGELGPADRARLTLRLRQLKNGIPLEYITKKVQFIDRQLEIHPGVFIPRLETEYFTELIIKLTPFEPLNILEVGTGCGAIAITLAGSFPRARIVATDISDRALANARANIEKFHLSDRIDLVQTDLDQGLVGQFDLIVSNPPYVPAERIPTLPKSVREFEPIRALNGGFGGIRFIKRLISAAGARLAEGGVIGIEIDEESVERLTDHLASAVYPYRFEKDLFDRYRYLFLGGFRK